VSKVETLPGATLPSVRLTDTRFRYTPASHTDIRKRFAPLFDEAERIEQERQRATLERENVTQMRRKP
jgi:hypothetical protein